MSGHGVDEGAETEEGTAWFRPVWDDNEAENAGAAPPWAPLADARQHSATEADARWDRDPQALAALLAPALAASDALARLDARAGTAGEAVREGLVRRLALHEAAGWLAAQAAWVHPLDLALRAEGLAGPFGLAAVAGRGGAEMPNTTATSVGEAWQALGRPGGVGVDELFAAASADHAVSRALRLARALERLVLLRTRDPLRSDPALVEALAALGAGEPDPARTAVWRRDARPGRYAPTGTGQSQIANGSTSPPSLDRPHRVGHGLALPRQNLNLTQLANDLLRLVVLACHPVLLRNAAGLSYPVAHFYGGRSPPPGRGPFPWPCRSCQARSYRSSLEPPVNQPIDGDVIQACHHKVCACCLQQGCIAEPGDAERRHAAGAGGLDAGGRIFDHEAVLGQHPKLHCRQQENLGVWLAPAQVAAADIGAEGIEQALAGSETDRLHHPIGVLRRRRGRHGPAQRSDCLDEAERVGVGLDASGRNQPLKPLLLALGIGGGLPLRVRHAQRFQGSTGAAEAWLAGDMGLIQRGGEAVWLGKALQGLAPGPLVRGGEQDAIDVEDACTQGRGGTRWGRRWFADGHGVGVTSNAVPDGSHSVRPSRATATGPRFAASEASRNAAPSHVRSNAAPR